MKSKYSEEFIKAFTLLNSKLDAIDMARYFKITPKDIKKIREDLGLEGI